MDPGALARGMGSSLEYMLCQLFAGHEPLMPTGSTVSP